VLLHIIARGKIGRSPEAELTERYLKRINWPTKVTELPDRGGTTPDPLGNGVTVVLDERGKPLSSVEFAKKLEGWRDNGRRRNERFATLDLIHTYGPDWKVIFVGDAAMSPYELVQAGGSVEYMNDEPGIVWLTRIFDHFRRVAWWNPEPERSWEYTRSTQIVLQKLGPRMFPLTLSGIGKGIDALRH